MKRALIRLIRQYGTQVEIESDNVVRPCRLFLQLVTSKSWQNMERMVPEAGEIRRGQFLVISEAREPLYPADTITAGGRHFIVRRADAIYLADTPLFYWGLCVEGGDRDPWEV